jgi:hypothetical protein
VTPQDEELKDKVEGAALLTGGTVAGAGVSATVGGMGLVGGFAGVAMAWLRLLLQFEFFINKPSRFKDFGFFRVCGNS